MEDQACWSWPTPAGRRLRLHQGMQPGSPDDVKGMKFRAAGKAFEQMLRAAGASITSMPSSEIYSGRQTGVLDGAITSSSSLVSTAWTNRSSA